jgi:carbon monoxide dehydrogenase subunit G
MNVQGTRSFAAPRETVWRVLNDPEQMAKLMPGVESFDVQDDRHWTANVKIPLGLGGLRMSINFEKQDEREPEFARLHAKGTGVGALMNMTTQFDLSDQGGGTAMRWQADVRIAGPVGSMGQRVLQPIVNQQVQNVLSALDKQVAAAAGSGDEPQLDDAGPPADVTPEADPSEGEGTSGAEEGLSPWDEEAYSEKPERPARLPDE